MSAHSHSEYVPGCFRCDLSRDEVRRRDTVLAEVRAERERQKVKWGEQNHPDGTGEKSLPLNRIVFSGPGITSGDTHYAFALSFMAKQATDRAAKGGTVTWADILLEEVFEALAESDPDKVRTELVQVAAVCAQWVEAIDRRTPLDREAGR